MLGGTHGCAGHASPRACSNATRGSMPSAWTALSQAPRRAGSVKTEFHGVLSRVRATPKPRKRGSEKVVAFWSAIASSGPVPGAGSSGWVPWPWTTPCRCRFRAALRDLRDGVVRVAVVDVVDGVGVGVVAVWLLVLPPLSPPREAATTATPMPITSAASAAQPPLPNRPTSASVDSSTFGVRNFERGPGFGKPHVKLLLLGLSLTALLLGGAPSAGAAAPAVDTGAVGSSALDSWHYKRAPHNVGLARGWPKQRFPGKQLHVPYVPNAWPVSGPGGWRNFGGSVGWYRTTLNVATAGPYAIRFESVNHRASVWLDGRLLARHKGVYMPFEVRPTLMPGNHLLVVRADWRDPIPGMKREGWHRGWFNYGGINREVTLRKLQASEIEAPVGQTKLGAKV